MRKIFISCLALLLVLNLAAPGYCNGPMKKLGRGVSNLLTCPLEMPNRIVEAFRRGGISEAGTLGLFEGACTMILRAAVGFWEVVTFPLPLPENYGPVMSDPEFLWPLPSDK